MNAISLNQIQQVSIAPRTEASPGKYTCEITLTDGRKKSVKLLSSSIGSLVQKISQEKINYQGRVEEFSKDLTSLDDSLREKHIEKILTKLFDVTTSETLSEEELLLVNSHTSRFFNTRNLLILAGVVTAVGITYLGLNYAQHLSEASELAANLQKSCVVTNQGQSFVGTREQIAKCGIDLFANIEQVMIDCTPEVVQKFAAKFPLRDTIFCDGTVKNNITGTVMVSSQNLSGALFKMDQLSEYLKSVLGRKIAPRLFLTINPNMREMMDAVDSTV
jgi:hypothetical protein